MKTGLATLSSAIYSRKQVAAAIGGAFPTIGGVEKLADCFGLALRVDAEGGVACLTGVAENDYLR